MTEYRPVPAVHRSIEMEGKSVTGGFVTRRNYAVEGLGVREGFVIGRAAAPQVGGHPRDWDRSRGRHKQRSCCMCCG